MCGSHDSGFESMWFDNYSLCGPCHSLGKFGNEIVMIGRFLVAHRILPKRYVQTIQVTDFRYFSFHRPMRSM